MEQPQQMEACLGAAPNKMWPITSIAFYIAIIKAIVAYITCGNTFIWPSVNTMYRSNQIAVWLIK